MKTLIFFCALNEPIFQFVTEPTYTEVCNLVTNWLEEDINGGLFNDGDYFYILRQGEDGVYRQEDDILSFERVVRFRPTTKRRSKLRGRQEEPNK